MQAIILCGGKGTRLASALPKDLPKAMADVNGKPFLWYLLQYWKPFISRFVLATGYGRSHIQNYFGESFDGSSLRYVEQTRGTAAAVRTSLIEISDDNFFVINGDSYFKVDPEAMMNYHTMNNYCFTLGYSALAGIHAGVDIMTKQYPWRASIFTSNAYFIDIGTPEKLEAFRKHAVEGL